MLLRMKGVRGGLSQIILRLYQAHCIVTQSFVFKILFYVYMFLIFLYLTTMIVKPYGFLTA